MGHRSNGDKGHQFLYKPDITAGPLSACCCHHEPRPSTQPRQSPTGDHHSTIAHFFDLTACEEMRGGWCAVVRWCVVWGRVAAAALGCHGLVRVVRGGEGPGGVPQ